MYDTDWNLYTQQYLQPIVAGLQIAIQTDVRFPFDCNSIVLGQPNCG